METRSGGALPSSIMTLPDRNNERLISKVELPSGETEKLLEFIGVSTLAAPPAGGVPGTPVLTPADWPKTASVHPSPASDAWRRQRGMDIASSFRPLIHRLCHRSAKIEPEIDDWN
jgi:hypothetical protein